MQIINEQLTKTINDDIRIAFQFQKTISYFSEYAERFEDILEKKVGVSGMSAYLAKRYKTFDFLYDLEKLDEEIDFLDNLSNLYVTDRFQVECQLVKSTLSKLIELRVKLPQYKNAFELLSPEEISKEETSKIEWRFCKSEPPQDPTVGTYWCKTYSNIHALFLYSKKEGWRELHPIPNSKVKMNPKIWTELPLFIKQFENE